MGMKKGLITVSVCDGSDCRTFAKKRGHYYRTSDGVRVQRYKCRCCNRGFSDATGAPCFGQKKRQINQILLLQFVSCCSMRRSARLLQINRKTVAKKLIFLGRWSAEWLKFFNSLTDPVRIMEFDDLETFEHSKLKPLSVTLAVEHGSRRILGFQVSQMPAKGKLAQKSKEKYGFREDQRGQARKVLFTELKNHVSKNGEIRSDMNPHYESDVREHFPNCTHRVFKGRRGCVVGQGELKSGGFDPLFSLNHTCAMLRDNIKRLSRRTWCTTKKRAYLELHIAIYALYHNLELIQKPSNIQL